MKCLIIARLMHWSLIPKTKALLTIICHFWQPKKGGWYNIGPIVIDTHHLKRILRLQSLFYSEIFFCVCLIAWGLTLAMIGFVGGKPVSLFLKLNLSFALPVGVWLQSHLSKQDRYFYHNAHLSLWALRGAAVFFHILLSVMGLYAFAQY